jgi:hypothetical protein
MSSHPKFNHQPARKTTAKSNIPIEPIADVVSADQEQYFIDALHAGQEDANRSPDHISSCSSSVPVQGTSIDNLFPARNSAGYPTTGGKGPAYLRSMKALWESQSINGTPMGSDGEKGVESEESEDEEEGVESEELGDEEDEGGFGTTSRKASAQGTFTVAGRTILRVTDLTTDEPNTTILAFTVAPTDSKKKQKRVPKVLPMDKVLSPSTIRKKYNRLEMNELLVKFGEDPCSSRFNIESMKNPELAEYLHDRQQKFVDAQEELVVVGPSRKRARVDSEDDGNYVNATFMGTPMSVVDITEVLCTIKRAACQDIEIQKPELHQSDCDMGQSQNVRMMILFDKQGNPHVSLNAQVGVHGILRLKDQNLFLYQQAGLSEEKELRLFKDLDIMLRKLSSDVANKISEDDMDSE